VLTIIRVVPVYLIINKPTIFFLPLTHPGHPYLIIVNIWFNLNILETTQSNDLTVPINPPTIYHTVQRNQRELQSVGAFRGNELQITTSID